MISKLDARSQHTSSAFSSLRSDAERRRGELAWQCQAASVFWLLTCSLAWLVLTPVTIVAGVSWSLVPAVAGTLFFVGLGRGLQGHFEGRRWHRRSSEP